MRRPAAAMTAIGLAAALALALWAGLPADEAVVVPAADDKAVARSDLPSADPVVSPRPATPQSATAGPSVPPPAAPAPTAALAVPIIVSIPQKLVVGEMHDLVIGLGSNARVGEVGFVVQFDANVLQVRGASQGSWAVDVGVNPRFAAEISTREDRVQIRSALSGQRVGSSGGSVAIVQFQPVAPGTTSVLITDVVVKDADGKPLSAALSASNLQVTVGS